MAILFTSDLHLGHKNIIDACGRPFENIKEMNEFLIKKWNHKVKYEDEVYILGDLSYRSGVSAASYLAQMKGKKHLIVGNHDYQWQKMIQDMSKYFVSVSDMEVIKIDKKLITLCHYPMLEWNGSRHASKQEDAISWLIHGHIHNSKEGFTYQFIKEHLPCALNAGVDINDFEPVTFEELLENNNRWYKRSSEHVKYLTF